MSSEITCPTCSDGHSLQLDNFIRHCVTLKHHRLLAQQTGKDSTICRKRLQDIFISHNLHERILEYLDNDITGRRRHNYQEILLRFP
ncbi:hypothetical protein L873DRAFT_1433705 [Choiromyces venosus 120613-1]|uniref:Uncharacterized protein n=1 Tax=Choiromyces venosus 120613-1 TaxID=1336337 RepID=A0A3N4JKK5_9PEZI|nr:hypothetical protein L873DRAFT_1433705 [Choiromyces venosus 120613-1]